MGKHIIYVFATPSTYVNTEYSCCSSLNTYIRTQGKHPRFPCSYYMQLTSRSPVDAQSPLLAHVASHNLRTYEPKRKFNLCTHTLYTDDQREKIYNKIFHLGKGRTGSLVNSPDNSPISRHCEVSALEVRDFLIHYLSRLWGSGWWRVVDGRNLNP